MSRQAEAIKRKVRERAFVPSPTPREFTIAVGPSALPPQVGYLVSEVGGVGSIEVGKLRRLIEPEDVR